MKSAKVVAAGEWVVGDPSLIFSALLPPSGNDPIAGGRSMTACKPGPGVKVTFPTSRRPDLVISDDAECITDTKCL
jgi:hypothetical protein